MGRSEFSSVKGESVLGSANLSVLFNILTREDFEDLLGFSVRELTRAGTFSEGKMYRISPEKSILRKELHP